MFEEDFQGVDLHDRTHTQEVDWMSNKLLPNHQQEMPNLISIMIQNLRILQIKNKE